VTIVVSSSGLSFFDYPFGILHRLFVLWPLTEQINGGEYRRTKGQSKKDNPEELTTMVTGQINVFDCPFGLRYSLTFICPVTIVVSSSGLSFFDYPFGILHRLFVL
jgi:hypothetical protein